MKKLTTIFCSFFLTATLFAQTPSDFFFKDSLPENSVAISKTPSKYIGEWRSNKDTLRSWFFTENKIYSQYKHVMILSEKEFKKSGYALKDNFVYGFSKTDSLPAIKKSDTIIFCYISEHEIIHYIKETPNEYVTELKNGLLLSQKEGDYFRYTLLEIKGDELILSEVDHENQSKDIVKKAKPEITYNDSKEPVQYLARMDKKNLEKFISSGYFNDVQRCTKVED